MRPRLRSTLYFLFLAGFFIAAPLIVLYTAGYRVNFQSGRLTGAGVLSATSVPRGALVLLDGERRARTPDVIDDVPPGKHVVRLERDGYLAWEKRLDFPARQTIFINDAVLYLDEAAAITSAIDPSAIARDASSRHLAYVTTLGPWTEVWARDASEDKGEIMARLPSGEAGEVSLAWSRDGSRLLVSSQGGKQLSIVATGSHARLDPASLIAGIEDAWWDAGSDATLFARLSGTLHAIDAGNGTIAPLPFEAEAAMSGDGGHYLVQDADGRAAVTWHEGDNSRIVAYLPSGSYAFRPAPQGLLMLEGESGRTYLLDANGGDRPILFDEDVAASQWHPEARSLLFSTGFDLRVYNADRHAQETITRVSDPIRSVAWYPPGGSVLYLSSERLVSIDLDRRGERHVVELAFGSGFSDLIIGEEGKRALLLGELNGQYGLIDRLLQR